jgi:IS4 transposase
VALGRGTTRCAHPMRVVQVLVEPTETKGKAAKWRSYLTNVVDPARLPAEHVAELYAERWHMEDAFNTVKRVLGLAYLWCGASNAVQVQLWATWILYRVLVDLTDSVAEAIKQPMKALSVEMVFRALYHYTQACQRDPTLKVVD